MIPTLQIFTRALLTPELSLATLSEARPATGADGLPFLIRTTRFAEAEIAWRGERWLLSLPLTPSALPRIERTASVLRRLNTPWLTSYRILPGELRWADASGTERTTDLVLQHLPAGRNFNDALRSELAQTLLAALDALEAALGELGFSHNNLKSSNLRWANGRLVPLRYHDAAFGGPRTADAEAFEALRRIVAEAAKPQTPQQVVSDKAASYDPRPAFAGHLWTSHLFEGLVCIQDEGGYGYVDAENRTVIPAQYLWAGDFREGRAEVETPTGMGLIDREGRYIIPPEYEIVDYDPAASIVRVRSNGRWALFDYLGRRLTEFGTIDAGFTPEH